VLYKGSGDEIQPCHYTNIQTRGHLVASGKKREIKDVSEMVGDFLREAAVLVLVFFPLDVAL
jgi:hypothetical protein